MRKVNYEVKQANGNIFTTPNYSEATKEGNRIIKTNLIDIDSRSDKEKEWMKAHAEKVAKKRE